MLGINYNIIRDKILEIVDDYTIYSFYIPDLVIDSVMLSPMRDEEHPSFIVKYGASDNLYHKDFSDSNYFGNCISFVMQKFGIPYEDALIKIDHDLGLGVVKGEPIKEYKEIKKPKKEDVSKKIPKIEIIPQSFTEKDLAYWGKFGIKLPDLIREGIVSVKHFFMENKEGEIKQMYKATDELCFAYKFFDDNGVFVGWKVYFPNRKEFKWFAGIPNSFMEGLNFIKNFKSLIISKSRKDRIVLTRFVPNVFSAQNEGTAFLTEENLNVISNFRKVYLWFDGDDAGKKNSKVIIEKTGWEPIFCPEHITEQNIKDPAEWYESTQSDEPIINFLRQKNII